MRNKQSEEKEKEEEERKMEVKKDGGKERGRNREEKARNPQDVKGVFLKETLQTRRE